MHLKNANFIEDSCAPKPSYIKLPALNQPFPSMLDFFDGHFPHVGREVWLQRLQTGKIQDESGNALNEATPYRIKSRLSYYREVKAEPRIPFEEHILYEDELILVADKPHFLPVTPTGKAVNECLLHRLMQRTGNKQLVALHRLDRNTAGLVLFSKQVETRPNYSKLFSQGLISKQYQAIASQPLDRSRREWLIESRVEPSGEWILNHNVEGEINARSRITKLESLSENLARFALSPITGKTHQLRLHMGLIGSQIKNDTFYPVLQPESAYRDYSKPLQLLAQSISFKDPMTALNHHFISSQQLHGL
ncbi:MAG: pseudouridine synthase [Mariprofundaceae bacterium]